jgi:regulator of replication initiation timing
MKEYKSKKESINRINSISEEINTLKSEMSEIKNLLQQLVKQNIEPK